MRIKADMDTVFKYLTQGELLQQWWPASSHTQPQLHGSIEFTWYNGTQLQTSFDVFDKPQRLAFDFAIERCEFVLQADAEGAIVEVCHSNCACRDGDLSGVIHVAQSWSSLLAGLKVLIEHGIDIRDGRVW